MPGKMAPSATPGSDERVSARTRLERHGKLTQTEAADNCGTERVNESSGEGEKTCDARKRGESSLLGSSRNVFTEKEAEERNDLARTVCERPRSVARTSEAAGRRRTDLDEEHERNLEPGFDEAGSNPPILNTTESLRDIWRVEGGKKDVVCEKRRQYRL